MFKQPCPSCDHAVPIKDEAMVGKKMDCPKCKFKFTVAAPEEFEVVDEDEATVEAKPKKKKSAGGDGEKSKSVGAALDSVNKTKKKPKPVEDEEDEKPKKKKKAAASGGNKNLIMIGAGVGVLVIGVIFVVMMMGGESNPSPSSTPSNNNNSLAQNNNNPMGMPMGAGGTDETSDGNNKQPIMPVATVKDISNLLPNETESIVSLNLDKLLAFPPTLSLLDPQSDAFFKASMGFGFREITKVLMGSWTKNTQSKSFIVMQLKSPVNLSDLRNQNKVPNMQVDPVPKRVGSKEYLVVRSNRFLDAVQEYYVKESAELMKQVAAAGVPFTNPPRDPSAWAIHIPEPTTFILTDVATMEAFLKAGGQPKFLSEYNAPEEVSDPSAIGGMGPMGMGPMGPMGMGPMGMGPMGMGPMGGMTPVAGSGGTKTFTNNPTFLTVSPTLKALMTQIEDGQQPVITFVADAAGKLADASKSLPLLEGNEEMTPKALGISIQQLTAKRATALALVEFNTSDSARKLAEGLQGLTNLLILPALIEFLGGPVEMKNATGNNNNGYPMGGGFSPMGPMGGIKIGDAGGLSPRGVGPMGGPMGSPMGMGPMGMGPMGTGPMTGYPNYGGGTTGNQGPATSFVSVTSSDRLLQVSADLDWNEAYRGKVRPIVANVITQAKGKAAMRSGATSWTALATTPKRFGENPLPMGAFPRPSNQARFGMPYPPSERVSWMAELLPMLGHGSLSFQLKREQAWNSDDNLPVAETWIPEFLNPTYAAKDWRASPPVLKGRSVGATNYVGVAGLGNDSGYYPVEDKRIGMLGYERQIKLADVTDGLENTMYMIQVPPTYQRPWIQGGATIQGVPTSKSVQPFLVTQPDGKKATMVLMGDGSIRMVSEKISDDVFKAMSTIKAGDKVADMDKNAPVYDLKTINQLQAAPTK